MGKELETWHYIFNEVGAKDEISLLWRKEYGKCKKIYIKANVPRMYYLAVNFGEVNTLGIPYNSTLIEDAEDRLYEKVSAKGYKKVDEVTKKETEQQVAAEVERQIEAEHGYCARYTLGECTGDCHGNRDDCNYPEGPNETMAECYVYGLL